MKLADGLAAVATVLAAVFLLPQIYRLAATRNLSGVSTTWALLGVATNLAWVGYLAGQRLWAPLVAPALAVTTYALMSIALVRLGPVGRRQTWMLVAYSVALGLASVAGPVPLAAVLAITPAIQLAPGVAEVYRHASPSGVSALTWALGGAEAVCWGTYGGMVGDQALLGYGVVTGAGSMLVLSRLWLTRDWPAPTRQRALP
jgi:hypothetical protein